jgi:hypothetical protein
MEFVPISVIKHNAFDTKSPLLEFQKCSEITIEISSFRWFNRIESVRTIQVARPVAFGRPGASAALTSF